MDDSISEQWDDLICKADQTRAIRGESEENDGGKQGRSPSLSPKRGRGRPRKHAETTNDAIESEPCKSPKPVKSKEKKQINKEEPILSIEEEKEAKELVAYEKVFKFYKSDLVLSKYVEDIEWKPRDGLLVLKEVVKECKIRFAKKFVDDMGKKGFFGLLDASEYAIFTYLKEKDISGCSKTLKEHPELWEVEVAEISIDLFAGLAPSPYTRLALSLGAFAQDYVLTKKQNHELNLKYDEE